MQNLPRRISWPAAAALLWPLVVIAPMFAHSGVPAFQHDWLWPLHPAQIQNFMTTGFQAWHRDGVGMPPVYPTAWWPYLLAGIFCTIAGVHGGLLLYVYAALAVASFGIRSLTRELQLSGAAQIGAIGVYAGNPFVLNEIHAGHLLMLWGYALLAWIAFAALDARSWKRVLTLGVLIGLAAAQQQFFAFGLIAAACIMLWRHPARSYAIVPAAVIAAIVCMPQWIAVAMGASTTSLYAMLPLHSWEVAQSSTASESLRLIGYIGGYDRALPTIVLWLLWLLPLGALAGFLRFTRESNAFTIAGIIGIAIATGVRGPLASFWAYGFSHWHALALFRELYDAGALTALAIAALCAIAVHHANAVRIGWLTAAVICLPMLYIAASASRGLPWVPSGGPLAQTIERVSAVDGDARVLPLPMAPPQTLDGARGGFSPLTIGVGAHPSAAYTIPSFAPLYLARLIESNDTMQTHVLAQRLDVGIAVAQPGVQPAFVSIVEPRLKQLASTFAGERTWHGAALTEFSAARIAVEPFSAVPGTLASRYVGARDLRAVQGGAAIDLDSLGTDPSPQISWARTALWPVLPAWVYAESLGVFTTRTAAMLNIPPALIVAGDARGSIHSPQCRRLQQLDAHFALLSCAAHPILLGSAPLTVAAAAQGAAPARRIAQSGAAGEAVIAGSGSARLLVHVHAAAGSAIVLRDAFDPGWSCSITGARHVIVDGYANGWVLPNAVNGTVIVFYRPAMAFYIALALSTALVTLWCVSPTIVFARGFRRASTEAIT